MSAKQKNKFQFLSADKCAGVMLLKAVMTDFSYGKHAHEEFAIGAPLNGIQEFSCNGQQLRAFPGSVILFNPEEVHNGNPAENLTLRYQMLYFDPSEFYPLLDCAATKNDNAFRSEENLFVDQVLHSFVMEMSKHVSEAKNSSLEYEWFLYQFARRLSQRMGMFQPDAWRDKKDSLLVRAKEYICDNIKQDMSIDDLSSEVHMSKYHFIRLFRSQFGLPPHKFILNYKINLVRKSLELGLSPTDVAMEYGFFDVSHMTRHFKKSYGVSPRQYQKQIEG
ncbi:AraC family transcriptional regulator [Halodesulfovibrio sp. MK-HDV]|uniref:AraC family transcriptional regulator n=1 Tax=Halodesulfovibrio sp. MK-HDV TaxID=2599925 RepID=UPI00136A5885|nr:AraC family transcriptional regulator [Halodesulfovibrio sp. MK-HDV]KAF1074118.1 Arabinose operon regulatory protein [Halodesulfovibrio sp. MK-HDV]